MGVIAGKLPVLDDDFFNEDRFKEWYNLLANFAIECISQLCDDIGNVENVAFELNTVLLQEVVYDAMIGLKTIVQSGNNKVEKPNPFKIASHLGYWFVRHKPIVFRAAYQLNVNDLCFPSDVDKNDKNYLIVLIKHINEATAAGFMLRYIFKVEAKPLCGEFMFRKVHYQGNLSFGSFEDMMKEVYEKLRYHLTYREISPKVLEHFLEAYTLHPYVPYTCDLWGIEGEG